MVIRLYTNIPGFSNDIADELRLFTDAAVCACESEAEAEVSVCLFEEGDLHAALAKAVLPEGKAEYRYTAPRPASSSELVQKRYGKRAVKIAAFRMMKEIFDTATPWGSLTGIRPTHLLRELQTELGNGEAERMMREEFDVSEEKYRLCEEIVNIQRPIFESLGKKDVGIYIGIPFCKTRCLYCSFTSGIRTKKTDMAAYIEALKKDIQIGEKLLRENGFRIRSMYMGGGTPTVLTAEELKDVLGFALDCYGGFGGELTVEAGRPDTIDREKLKVLKDFGVSRISINPQSMVPETLERIGRSHSPEEIGDCFRLARDLGFDNINMDVICGLPGEGKAEMERTLSAIETLRPDDLTVHTLALKRGSKLMEKLGDYPLPDGETVEEMVNMGRACADRLGLVPYYMYRQKYMRGNLENVGYARPDKVCIYNVDMMEESCAIMAHGGGAMTKRVFDRERRVERIPNPKDPDTYINKVEQLGEEKRKLFME